MQTQSVIVFSIIAATISFISLIITIVNCVILVKNYKKSKRIEFFQRRDYLLQKISELNAKNSEARSFAARYEVVAMKNAALSLDPKYKERNEELITSLKKLSHNIDSGVEEWNGLIKDLHSMCSSFTPKTDTERIERFIAMVQGALDEVTQFHQGSLSALHILESTNPIFEPVIARLNEEIKQIQSNLGKAVKELKEDEKGVVRKVTITPKEIPEPTTLPAEPKPNKKQ
jgi:hypothetical protein